MLTQKTISIAGFFKSLFIWNANRGGAADYDVGRHLLETQRDLREARRLLDQAQAFRESAEAAYRENLKLVTRVTVENVELRENLRFLESIAEIRAAG